ncbi:APC family permease [Brevibacillus nitrificans]|uniref:APC family permease n=1 Tax=Brevibacillus nitrificans TaxID=651560 RepID=A0A3M8DK28_9BACL|nr:APC family permease [Brevibacillus nitrificans]RNB88470.1 APC family permease [Brevibacillus nitrificans]
MEDTRLERTLTLAHLVLFGISFMALGTVFSTYGIVAQMTQGMVPSAYILALIAMLFTALSYGRMASAYPISGSAYTYAQKAISPSVGFMVGWSILVDYLFLPMVNYLVFANFIHAAIPSVPVYVWILLMLVLVTVVNVRGVKLAANVSLVVNLCAILFIVVFSFLSIRHILTNQSVFELFSISPFFQHGIDISTVVAGASILCFSFLGFDSVTTFAEEVKKPEKTLPRAVLLVTIIGGIVFIAVSYLAQLVYPDYASFANPDSAAFEIIQYIGGEALASFFIVMIATGTFGSAMVSHASVGRLLYSMGRDGVLPKKWFGYIHPTFKTPARNLLFVSLISLSALFLSLGTAASLINFGAFLAFSCVNISVIMHFYIRRKERSGVGAFRNLLFPIIGTAMDLYLLLNLDSYSLVLGISWLIIGFVYLLVLTKGFKQQPPQMGMDAA